MWRAIALFFLLACSQFLVVGAGANASAASVAIYDYGAAVHAYDRARHTVAVRTREAAPVAPRNVFPSPQETVATAKGPLPVFSRLSVAATAISLLSPPISTVLMPSYHIRPTRPWLSASKTPLRAGAH